MSLKQKKKPRPPQKYCKCGCGAPTNFHRGKGYSTWLVGHFRRKKRELVFCACGCDNKRISIPTSTTPRRYILGHSRKGKPSANRGKQLSEQWRYNMALALIRSWKSRKNKKP